MDLNTALLYRLEEARAGLESVLPRVDRAALVYPGWTLKQILDHITGWDEAMITCLRAHHHGQTPPTPAAIGIDAYNAQSIARREHLDFEHTYQEFHAVRLLLKEILTEIPEEKLAEPFVFPWGANGTVSELIEIFAHHEQEHTADLLLWLEDPTQPLSGNSYG
jgi:hypothetical protein